MKLDTLLCSCNNSDLNPKPGKRILAGKLPGGCYRSRRKVAMTTNRGVVAVPRGWFGVVKKKLHVKTKLTPHNNKNIIIIHNNTSITSNEEDNRASSCVEPGKDQIATKINKVVGGQEDQDLKDLKKQKPSGGVVVKTTVIDDSMKDVAVVDRKSLDIKDQKETPSVGVAEVDKSVMADGETKTEIKGGDQEEESKKSKDDNEDDQNENDINVEEKLALPNADAEAINGRRMRRRNKRKEEEEEEQAELSDEEKAVAAITIQTAFRSHLARRAFRALKSLVRLQAVARGVVVRRQARMALHCMRALVRLGDRVRARQLLSTSSHE